MKIHIVMHESFEAPAAITTWAKNRNNQLTFTRLYEDDEFPTEIDDIDFLIIMGGPQSPATKTSECPHFDTEKEIAFIKKVIKADKLLLGICLGAQLIGESLGAEFAHSPSREIGVFPIKLTQEGKNDPIFSSFPTTFAVGHWHGDMPGLTAKSKILAFSEGCPRQIVRYSSKIYGFQCHFELTPDAIEDMIANNASELEIYKNSPYIWEKDKLRNQSYLEMNQLLFEFLDKFVAH